MRSFGDVLLDKIVNELGQTFPNLNKRIRIWAETDKYHWKEDESVWKQKKDQVAPQYEVYMDGEFICFIDSSKGLSTCWLEFVTKLLDLYKKGQIFVHERMYEVKIAEQEAKRLASKTVEMPKPYTEEEKVLAGVIENQAKKKKKKVITK